MYNPEEITRRRMQLEDEIYELMYEPVFDAEGEIISYADWLEKNKD